MRSIVQIAASASEESDSVYALDSEGVLWDGYYDHVEKKFVWHRKPDLPEDAR